MGNIGSHDDLTSGRRGHQGETTTRPAARGLQATEMVSLVISSAQQHKYLRHTAAILIVRPKAGIEAFEYPALGLESGQFVWRARSLLSKLIAPSATSLR